MENLLLALSVIKSIVDNTYTCKVCKKEYNYRKQHGLTVKEAINYIDQYDYRYLSSSFILRDCILEKSVALKNNDYPEGLVICKKCFYKNLKKFDQKYTECYSKMNLVKTYPASYNKVFDLDENISSKIITYNFATNKNETINKIKFLAAYQGYNIVYNVTYNHIKQTVTGVYAKTKD